MLGKFFGRKEAEPQKKYIIPPGDFDPKTSRGQMLARLGFKADDASNVLPSIQDLKDTVAKSELEMLAFIKTVNEGLKGAGPACTVKPYFMIPAEVWGTNLGPLLIGSLKLTPYDSWNCLPLGADVKSAFILNIKEHPGPATKEQIGGAYQFVGGAIAKVTKVTAEIKSGLSQGDIGVLDKLPPALAQASDDLKTFALYYAVTLLGADTMARSRKLFFNENYDSLKDVK